jgi:anthranilate synthase component 1
MNYYKQNIETLAENYNRIPLFRELNISSLDFLSLLKAMRDDEYFIFLESAGKTKHKGRFSYLCFNPAAAVTAYDSYVIIKNNETTERIEKDLFEFLDAELKKYSSPDTELFGDFNGGYTGYIGYESINKTGILRKKVKQDAALPLAELLLVDEFIIFDNYTEKYYVSAPVYTSRGEIHTIVKNTEARLAELENYILNLILKEKISYLPLRPREVSMEYLEYESTFIKKITNVKELISCGEIIQAVISRRMEVRENISPYKFYLKIRNINPSPYMYLLKFGSRHIAGCSPETHLKIKKNIMHLKPIAGTAPIPSSAKEKRRIRKELLLDQKERAEHLMLVDLARNDLSRLAERASVTVSTFMRVEDYSHVMHIVSDVKGIMKNGSSIVDVFRFSFPAGTVTGAPKVRAVEIIDEVESMPREAYAGAVGYFGFNRTSDTCITIRSAFFDSGMVHLQAGAGIVYDSVPEKESTEIRNKLMALTTSLGYAV